MSQLKTDLKKVEKVLFEAVKNNDNYIQLAAEHLIEAGGKRIRPKLVLLSYYIAQNEYNNQQNKNTLRKNKNSLVANEKVIRAAASIELEHLATLYHDDIIDNANMRRGVKAAHKVFGENIAIVIGDYLFACAFKLGTNLGKKIINKQSETLYKLCVGQIHDVNNEKKKIISKSEYLSVLNDKTAELISCAMFIGATLGGGSENLIKSLQIFGINYGIAFQIKDDLLDLKNNTGKPIGTDLKKYLPTIVSILIKEGNNKKLKRRISSKFIKFQNINRLASIIKKSAEYKKSIDVLQYYINNANDSLKNINNSNYKNKLINANNKLNMN